METNRSISALHDITLFVEVAQHLSFSAAGRQLGLSVATVSRRIAALERSVGVHLFHRSTRRVELTEIGRRHFERCVHLAEEARLAEAALRDHVKQPKGRLKMAMPVDLGMYVIAPWLVEFAQRYPDLSFDLDLSSHRLDLPVDTNDLVLQIGEPTDDRLIVRHLGMLEAKLYAAPAYLRAHGRPEHPADLAGHQCLTRYSEPQVATWPFTRDGEVVETWPRGRFVSNNQTVLKMLVERGLGIARIPAILMRDSESAGRLERVLPEWSLPGLPLYAAMATRSQPLRVRTLLDFLGAQMSALKAPV